jgi:hypothetical protein
MESEAAARLRLVAVTAAGLILRAASLAERRIRRKYRINMRV